MKRGAVVRTDHPWWRKPLARVPRYVDPARCAGKLGHETWREAEDQLLALIDQDHRFGVPRASLGLTVYHCTVCALWHVGHGIGSDPDASGLAAQVRRARREVGS